MPYRKASTEVSMLISSPCHSPPVVPLCTVRGHFHLGHMYMPGALRGVNCKFHHWYHKVCPDKISIKFDTCDWCDYDMSYAHVTQSVTLISKHKKLFNYDLTIFDTELFSGNIILSMVLYICTEKSFRAWRKTMTQMCHGNFKIKVYLSDDGVLTWHRCYWIVAHLI